MVKIKTKVIALLALMLMLTIVGCSVDEQSEQCLESLKKGLYERWSFTDKDFNGYNEFKENTEKGIEAELNMLKEYKNTDFKDANFEENIKKYIQALENQKEGITYIFDDAKKYNELYIEKGAKIRSKCLKKLTDEYGLKVDSKYNDTFEEVLKSNIPNLISSNELVEVNTEYGKVKVQIMGFDVLTNPADEKELVLYCGVENISYYDEYNEGFVSLDNFIGVYDSNGYLIQPKGEAYGYIEGYKELAGAFAELKKGNKSKFAVIYDFAEDIDVLCVDVVGEPEEQHYRCYLKSN